GCLQPKGTEMQAHAGESVIIFGNAWLPYSGWIWEQNSGNRGGAGGANVPAHKSTHLSWSLSASPPPNIPGCEGATYQFRLMNYATGHSQMGQMHTDPATGVTTGQNIYDDNTGSSNGGLLGVEYFIGGGCGFGINVSGHMTYTQSPVTTAWNPMDPCPSMKKKDD